MHSAELQHATRAVQQALAESGVSDLLARMDGTNPTDWPRPEEVAACFGALVQLSASFGAPEGTLLAELGLGELVQPGWWSHLIVGAKLARLGDAVAKELAGMRARIDTATAMLPVVLKLGGPRIGATGETLSIILASEDGEPAPPLRLAAAVQAVALLWDAVCSLRGETAELALTGADPAQGVAALFTGDPRTMAELKAILLNVWEQVLVHHDLSLDGRVSAIPPSLAIMDRIANTRPGEAASLHRRVQDGVTLILETGACIPEMRVPTRFSPAALMRPRRDGDASTDAAAAAPAPNAASSDLASIVEEERRGLVGTQAPRRRIWSNPAPTEPEAAEDAPVSRTRQR